MPHGLRKAGMRRLAEHGATTKEIASMSGHRSLREIERYTGPNTMVLEMYAPDPKTGKEFKTMEIACTRASGGDGGMTKPMPTR